MGSRSYAAALKQLESLRKGEYNYDYNDFNETTTLDHPLNGANSLPSYIPGSLKSTTANYVPTGITNRTDPTCDTHRHRYYAQQHHLESNHAPPNQLEQTQQQILQQQQYQQPHNSLLYGLGGLNSYAISHPGLAPNEYGNFDPHQHQYNSFTVSPAASSSSSAAVATAASAAAAEAAAAAAAFNSEHHGSRHGTNYQNHVRSRVNSFDNFLMMNPTLLTSNCTQPLPVASNLKSTSSHCETSAVASPVASNLKSTSPHCETAAVASPIPSSSDLYPGHNTKPDDFLDDFQLDVPGLATEPFLGRPLLTKVRMSLDHVTQRYIPCVDFLVQCQQELRRGLTTTSTSSSRGGRNSKGLSARQFFSMYVQNLPHRFQAKNQYFMEKQALHEAVKGINELVVDAHRAQTSGSEAVKNQFLGGMKDGQSWGLRKWMSIHGNALHISTSIECIHQAVHNLDRNSDTTRKLTAILRPMASEALKRLQSDIPKTYQAHSTAHPYLPFFHRLESALRSMALYDPDDDDVIVLDSSDDDEPEPVVSTTTSLSRKHQRPIQETTRTARAATKPPMPTQDLSPLKKRRIHEDPPPLPRAFVALPEILSPNVAVAHNDELILNNSPEIFVINDDDSSSGEESLVDILEITNNKKQNPQDANGNVPGRKCPSCMKMAYSSSDTCEHCGEINFLQDVNFLGSVEALFGKKGDKSACSSRTASPLGIICQELQFDESFLDAKPRGKEDASSTLVTFSWPLPLPEPNTVYAASLLMADTIDRIAALFDQNQQHFIRPPSAPYGPFWDGERFAAALKLLSTLLRKTDTSHFVEPMDNNRLIQNGQPPFYAVVRHPISFREIVASLVQDVEGGDSIVPIAMDGVLSESKTLNTWNMWKGMELLQAIDLIFLNSLAYGKVLEGDGGIITNSCYRARTNKLRKDLWDGINRIVVEHVGSADVERRRLCTPIRRAESSGFVVYK